MADWTGRRVAVIGFARQGKALARYLAEHGARVVVNDKRSAEKLALSMQDLADLPIEYVLGSHPPELIEDIDMLCLSGGVSVDLPLAIEARRQGIPLSNDSQIFLEACPAPIVGITGSAGKSTTTSLTGRMATKGFEGTRRHVWVGGNIGNPLIRDLDEMKSDDLVVMELSSFQLEIMSASPEVAAVLNVTPNHLDRHKTMAAYLAAKAHILEFQASEDTAVLGREDSGAWGFRNRVRGRLLSFGRQNSGKGDGAFIRDDGLYLSQQGKEIMVCPLQKIELRGSHNMLNVAAACVLAAAVGVSPEAIQAGIEGFTGLPHRLEFVRRLRGAEWYDDSIATTPERAIAGMQSFGESLILLAGGRDKDLPWDDCAAMICERVKHLILFGEAAQKIAKAVSSQCCSDRPLSVSIYLGLDEAVEGAVRVAEPGDVVLLAPGGTSFDQFADFEERGERFKTLVEAL